MAVKMKAAEIRLLKIVDPDIPLSDKNLDFKYKCQIFRA